jgi:hypothetical protein
MDNKESTLSATGYINNMLSKTIHSKIGANIDSLKTFLCSSNNYKQQFDVTNCLLFCLKAASDNDSSKHLRL